MLASTFIVVVALLTSGCGSPTSPAAAESVTPVTPAPVQEFTLRGVVTDGTSRGVLPNIEIAIPDGANAGRSTRTDAAGAYVMDHLTSGTFTVTASALSS